MAKKARRTTHRSTSGTELYAVRDAKGRFKDILMPTGWSWPSSLHAALARRARAPGERFRGRLARAEHGKILSANVDFNDPHGVNPEEGSWPHGKSRAC